jgi:hypothetical protein
MSGIQILNADLDFGLAKEEEVITVLEEIFNETILKAPYKYSPFDAQSAEARYEIKCRRCHFNRYDETIITVDKIQRTPKNKPLRLVFGFTDGLYYTEYEKERFDTYPIRPVSAVKWNGQREARDHYHIPIHDLRRVSGQIGT